MSFGFAAPTGRMAARRSSAESDIRAAVVEWVRADTPGARVVHELNVECGETRADVAAIEPERLTLFEIKSKLDTLKRLDKQYRQFQAVSHRAFVVADERWFRRPELVGDDVEAWEPIEELTAGARSCRAVARRPPS